MKRMVLQWMIIIFGAASIFAADVTAVDMQAPGYQRMVLGDYVVTALFDGFIQMNMKILKNAPDEELQKLLERGFMDPMKLRIEVNAFVIDTGAEKILVDMGSGTFFGPTVGKAYENMGKAGIRAEEITKILLTHMHPDHVGGLIDKEGLARFVNATIYCAKTESDFWLSDEMMEKAPEGGKNFFAMARTCSAPYRKDGKWKTLEPSDSPAKGVKMVPAPGHTPGHCAYEVTSGGETLMIVGDVVHCMAAQLARPEIYVGFDTNSAQAIESRKAVLDDVSGRKAWVAGMHLPFPGLGKMRKEQDGSYSWVPILFSQPSILP